MRKINESYLAKAHAKYFSSICVIMLEFVKNDKLVVKHNLFSTYSLLVKTILKQMKIVAYNLQ